MGRGGDGLRWVCLGRHCGCGSGLSRRRPVLPSTRWAPAADERALARAGAARSCGSSKCAPEIGAAGQRTDWIVEDWSRRPLPVPPQSRLRRSHPPPGTGEHRGRGLRQGRTSMPLSSPGSRRSSSSSPDRNGNPVLKHQFLAGVARARDPDAARSGRRYLGQRPARRRGRARRSVRGRPVPTAGDPPGRVQVQVFGTLPLGNNFSGARSAGPPSSSRSRTTAPPTGTISLEGSRRPRRLATA